jgi:cytochrome P450
MIHYPHVMRKAQAEIDSVVGRDRVPTFADRPHLPYIQAIVKELLRWRPAGPLGEFFTVKAGFWSTHFDMINMIKVSPDALQR